MNIFKVLASGKKSFPEENASVLLAWLMNPNMEHGLGYGFLAEFVERVTAASPEQSRGEFERLSERLRPRLRNEGEDEVSITCQLEYNTGTAFIDILFTIDNWKLAIENKIYMESVCYNDQLECQYNSLKDRLKENKGGEKENSYNICSIFLVPIEDGGEVLDQRSENAYKSLHEKLWSNNSSEDFCVLVTWQRNSLNAMPSVGEGPAMVEVPSVSDMIRNLLEKEQRGDIEPIPDYTKQTLKALNMFITNDFSGYEYGRDRSYVGGLNDATEERLGVNQLMEKQKGYVGVKGGLPGLCKMEKEKLDSHSFQYTTQNMEKEKWWLGLEEFKNVVKWKWKWKCKGDKLPVDWRGVFPAQVLFQIAEDYGDKVYIGIQGGEKALRRMDNETIRSKKWNIDTKQQSTQWVAGKTFTAIIKAKGVF